MRWSVLGLIAVGVVAAACAAVLVMANRAGGRGGAGATSKPADEVVVLVAAKDLPAVTVVDKELIATKRLPRKQAPKGHATSPVAILGKVLAVDMVEGQAFTPDCFATQGSGRKLAASLGDMQSFCISLSDHTGLRGLLYPGSVVDVLASFKVPSEDDELSQAVSMTLLQKVLVLGIDDETIVSEEKDDSSKGAPSRYGRKINVFLRVTPAQARELHLASTYGTLSLALRNPLDGVSSKQGATFLSDLSNDLVKRLLRASMVAAQRAEATGQRPVGSPGETDVSAVPAHFSLPARWEIQVIRGGQTENESVAYPKLPRKSK